MRLNKLTNVLVLQSKTPHTLIGGISGYGKGVWAEAYVTKHIGEWKVFDINSESRGEGMFYGFKQENNAMVERIDYLSNGLVKPKAYDNEIIMFLGNNLKKLKRLPRNIKICVFNEEWITNEDLKNFLAFNESQIGFMDTVFEIHDDQHITLTEFYEYMMRVSMPSKERQQLKDFGGGHYMTINTLKRRARSLLRSGLFWNDSKDIPDYFEYLNLDKSVRYPDAITTYSRYLIDNPYTSYVCMNVLIKKFIEYIELRESEVPLLFYVRELNDFYRMKDPPQYVIEIQENLDKILRKGRFLGKSKIMLVCDTQLLNDIPTYMFNSFNKYILFRLPLGDSKRILNKATIPPQYLLALSRLEVGYYMGVISGAFQYPCMALPTLHKKAEPDFDVFEHLINLYGAKNYSSSIFIKEG